jgi:hypothetical protein
MLKEETKIWERFLAQNLYNFISIKYDVHLGKGITPRSEETPEYKRMIQALSQKRVDVIAEDETYVYIIEVKKSAGLSALGQLLAYKHLYEQAYTTWKPIKLICVTNHILPDDLEALQRHNIIVHVI